MKDKQDTKALVASFMEDIWNQRRFDTLDTFLHPDFVDHSLPPGFTPDKTGLQKWVEATGHSFEHHTVLLQQVTDGALTILKIQLQLKHTGVWRDIPATGLDVQANGYRSFRVQDGKIIEHWALIDGNALENQLRQTEHGCKTQP